MFSLDKFYKKEISGGGGGDGGAGERRRQEKERQRNIENISTRVNSIFDKYGKAGWVDGEYRGQGGEFVPGRIESSSNLLARKDEDDFAPSPRTGMFNQHIGDKEEWIEPTITEYQMPDNGITYFDMLRDNYVDNYTPKLQDQYSDAREQLALRLASKGLTDSSVANNRYSDMQERFDNTRVDIGDRALSAAHEAEANIEGTRSDLIGMAEGGAGMENVAAKAAAKAKALSAPRQYDPLGDVFANLTALGANAAAARNAGYRGFEGKAQGIFNPNPTGRGSARNVK